MQPFQNHPSTRTLLTQSSVSKETWIMKVQTIAFPNVTDKEDFSRPCTKYSSSYSEELYHRRHKQQPCSLFPVQIWNIYVTIYISYELSVSNNVTTTTGIQTFHIIGIWHIVITLYIHLPVHCYCSLCKDPTLVHIYIQNAFNYHIIAIYVPTTNMPLKC